MAKNLVIVESPAKAKTIEKFLGNEFKVVSSFGHVADLPLRELGVDVANDFKPKYIISNDKKQVVKTLKDLSKKSEMVWLASDEDREGEAIAWHLSEALGLDAVKTKRIVFHEITKKAILKAIETPRAINYDLVNAQQARRVLDRLVGYELSPVLWRKIKSGLSAGRVQSVAVRLIVEKEREIETFKPRISYRVAAEFAADNGKPFRAKLSRQLSDATEAKAFLEALKGAEFGVMDLQVKPAKKSPTAPFTTSTLQQEASRKLGFPVAKTMMVAQRLYEAGLITYMRTDSVNLSDDAKQAAKQEITATYGADYSFPRNYTTKSKGAQEAHEAIRPTDISRKEVLAENDQNRLYGLIWKRTIASQMSDAKLEKTTLKINNNKNEEIFNAQGEVLKFDGFLKVYLEGTDIEEEEQQGMLPVLNIGTPLTYNYITATEHYTKPPYRYTEASLVKKLEELGIGRPSTYAPTISTIQRREYVAKGTIEGTKRSYEQLLLKNDTIRQNKLSETIGSDKGKLVPTDIGIIVNDFLVAHFENILDYGFTAKVEEDFDKISEGNENWTQMIRGFYETFHPIVEDVSENAGKAKGERLLGTDPASGKEVYAKLGRYGAMIQIGSVDDEEKPKFASLQKEQNLKTITLEEALDLFLLPKDLGLHEGVSVIVSNGRFGPYIRYDKLFVSLPRGEDPLSVDLERAIILIKEKQKADAPIAEYEKLPVTKGVGRFGPFIKWNDLFINVSKKYDFDNLTKEDIATLIEDKKQKEIARYIKRWDDEGISVQKGRWGRKYIHKGKTKIELPKEVDADTLTLNAVKEMIKQKTSKAKPKKAVTKK